MSQSNPQTTNTQVQSGGGTSTNQQVPSQTQSGGATSPQIQAQIIQQTQVPKQEPSTPSYPTALPDFSGVANREEIDRLLSRIDDVLQMNTTLKTAFMLGVDSLLQFSDNTQEQIRVILDFTSIVEQDVTIGGVTFPNAAKLIKQTQAKIDEILLSFPSDLAGVRNKLKADFDVFLSEHTHLINAFKVSFSEDLIKISSKLETDYKNKALMLDALKADTDNYLKTMKEQVASKIQELDNLDLVQQLQQTKQQIQQEFQSFRQEAEQLKNDINTNIQTKMETIESNAQSLATTLKSDVKEAIARLKGFDYIESTPPSKTINPSNQNALYLDTTEGILWICRDNTKDANVWEEFLQASGGGYEYILDRNPTLQENPKQNNAMFLNTKTMETFICLDNTPGANIWKGSNGTQIKVMTEFYPVTDPSESAQAPKEERQKIHINQNDGFAWVWVDELKKYKPILQYNAPKEVPPNSGPSAYRGKTLYLLQRPPSLSAQNAVNNTESDTETKVGHQGLVDIPACNVEGCLYIAKWEEWYYKDTKITQAFLNETKQKSGEEGKKNVLEYREKREEIRGFYCYKNASKELKLKEVIDFKKAGIEITTENLADSPELEDHKLTLNIKKRVFYASYKGKWHRLAPSGNIYPYSVDDFFGHKSNPFYDDFLKKDFGSKQEKIDYMCKNRIYDDWLYDELGLIKPNLSERDLEFKIDKNFVQTTKYTYYLHVLSPYNVDSYYKENIVGSMIYNNSNSYNSTSGYYKCRQPDLKQANFKAFLLNGEEVQDGYFKTQEYFHQYIGGDSDTCPWGWWHKNGGWDSYYGQSFPTYGGTGYLVSAYANGYYNVGVNFNRIMGVNKGALIVVHPFEKIRKWNGYEKWFCSPRQGYERCERSWATHLTGGFYTWFLRDNVVFTAKIVAKKLYAGE